MRDQLRDQCWNQLGEYAKATPSVQTFDDFCRESRLRSIMWCDAQDLRAFLFTSGSPEHRDRLLTELWPFFDLMVKAEARADNPATQFLGGSATP